MPAARDGDLTCGDPPRVTITTEEADTVCTCVPGVYLRSL